jgi:hypothetical protein
MLDIKHLEHVKGMILDGLKMELKETILASYSISDQLNASGTAATTIRTGIAAILATGHAKRDAVIAATTFEELNAVIPMDAEE